MSALVEKLQRLRREAGVRQDAASPRGGAVAAAASAVPVAADMAGARRRPDSPDAAATQMPGAAGSPALPAGSADAGAVGAGRRPLAAAGTTKLAAGELASRDAAAAALPSAAMPVARAVAELARLRRLLDLRPARSLAPRTAPAPEPEPPLSGDCIAPGLYAIERRYAAVATAPLLPPRWCDGAPVARERFLCFDTETTGLAGGSGTRAFMIGAADWHGGELRVRQLYLTAMAGEAAMLDAFAAWLRPDTVLVSYNGRSYDAPLLATRYRLQRLADPLRGLAHVDLLHPVRRVYRGRWENCRLATIERNVLRIVRDDDLPGSEAPAAWRSYLRAGKTTDLLRVLEHNRQDVATLARLLEHMDQNATPAAWLTSA